MAAKNSQSMPIHRCTPCGKTFQSAQSLQKHSCRRSRDPTKMKSCDHCDYRTCHNRDLTVHMAKHDSSIQVFRCAPCGKAFLKEESLDLHNCRRCDPSKKKKCPHCDYRSFHSRDFKVHLAKHDPTIKIYKCTLCRRSYGSESSLNNHKCSKS